MSQFVITVIFLSIGALFWIIKTVAEVQARKAAGQEFAEQDADDDRREESGYDFYGITIEPAFERSPPPPPAPARIPVAPALHRTAVVPPRPKAPALKPKAAPPARSRYAAWLKKNARAAIMTQEVLGPPKSLQ